MTVLDSAPLDVLDAYRTCEFVTLGRDGTPLAWPTAVRRRGDGTLVLTTSLAFAQKALNIRRDGRVALLFSDPTGSGLTDAPQLFVGGRAECPDDIRTGPQDLEDYWRMLFERQPHSRAYLSRPMRRLMDWYYLRLLITVTPEQLIVRSAARPPLPEAPAPRHRRWEPTDSPATTPRSWRAGTPPEPPCWPAPARCRRPAASRYGPRRLRRDTGPRLAAGAPARRADQQHAQRTRPGEADPGR